MGARERRSAPRNFSSIPMNSPTSATTGFSSTTISVSPRSAGVSYTWNDWKAAVDGLYGNGLRRGFANTMKNHPYETFNRQPATPD